MNKSSFILSSQTVKLPRGNWQTSRGCQQSKHCMLRDAASYQSTNLSSIRPPSVLLCCEACSSLGHAIQPFQQGVKGSDESSSVDQQEHVLSKEARSQLHKEN